MTEKDDDIVLKYNARGPNSKGDAKEDDMLLSLKDKQ